MLDPRIDDLFKENKKLRAAIKSLAAYVEGIAYRVATPDEKNITILDEILEILLKEAT